MQSGYTCERRNLPSNLAPSVVCRGYTARASNAMSNQGDEKNKNKDKV
jgi:hypothetical protein